MFCCAWSDLWARAALLQFAEYETDELSDIPEEAEHDLSDSVRPSQARAAINWHVSGILDGTHL